MKKINFLKVCLAILLLTILDSDVKSQLRNQMFVGARPLGLGETFVAIADDGNAAYWNPAGLQTLKRLVFNSMYTNLYNIQGLRNIYLSQMFPITQRYAIGASWFYFGFNDDEFDFYRHKIHISFGARTYKNLYIGANLKYLNTGAKLDEFSMGKANGFGYDFGALYSLPLKDIGFLKRINLGMMIHDIGGTAVAYSRTNNSETILPQNIRFGLSFYFKEMISLKWFSLRDALLAFDFDDRFHVGTEAWLLDILGLRAGLQKDFHTDERMIYSFGLSLRFKNLQSNYAYVTPPTLPSSNVFSLSFSYSLSPINITDISVNGMNHIFASFYKSYANSNIVDVALRNDYDQTLNGTMKISFPGLPASFRDTNFKLEPKELQRLEFPANFSESILEVREPKERYVEISIEYKIENLEKQTRAINKFRLYGRGALTWDDPGKAATFITKQDRMVNHFVRHVTNNIPYRTTAELGNLYTAAAIFDGMGGIGIRYREDPETPYSRILKNQQTIDHIQYPAELLKNKQGDCDDLTVLYASLLECSGIRTALVNTNDYITIMLDTGLNEENQKFLPFGDSLFVIRNRSIWIPLEVTQVGNTFEEAWQVGGKKYRETEHNDDFRVIRVSEVENIYPSALPGELQDQVPDLPDDEYFVRSIDSLTWIKQQKINLERDYYLAELQLRPTDSRLRNKLGVILVHQDSMANACTHFEEIIKSEPRNPQVLNNMANIHFISGRYLNAEECYLKAERYITDQPGLYLNLSILYQQLKIENPVDSKRFQGESEKYLLKAFELLAGDEVKALKLLQISTDVVYPG
ncbi:MAG: PorV/PorQ family protein, partial [bacterium]